MKPALVFLLLLSLLGIYRSDAQNAPVTTAGSVYGPGPGITVAVTVTDFSDIGSFTLTLDFNNSIVQVTAVTPNAAFTGFTADWTTTPGRLVMSWTGASGVALADYAHLADITFTGLTASQTDLTWFDNGASCQYQAYNGGAFTVLNDSPTSYYYKNGRVTWQRPGPVTIAPVYYSGPNQAICIPITVNRFTHIGSVSLTLDYNSALLSFTGFTAPNIPGTWVFDAQEPVPGRMTVGGYGPGLTLADGSILLNACFNYTAGPVTLAWYDTDGTSCEYSSADTVVPLYDLPQASFYTNGQIIQMVTPTADFTADDVTPLVGQDVTFTDLSAGPPQTWAWSFSPSTVTYLGGTTASSQNPLVEFTVNGIYSVTLTVTNPVGSNSVTKTSYLHVGTPGLWTGITSINWGTASNWHNYLVPDAITDVVVPASAPYWPYHSGNLALGTVCRNVTMEGAAEMTIEGSLVINPGTQYKFTGSGRLQVIQNWTNDGIFLCGTSTVEFINPIESQITGGLTTANKVANFIREQYSAAMVPLVGGTAGPTSDDSHADVNIGFTFNYLGDPYTQVRINSNGWISLNLSGADPSSNNAQLFTATAPNTTLAPWWDGLKVTGGTSITYQTSGVAPNRVFTVEWKDIMSFKSAANARLNFQVVLHETTGVIEFVYGTVVPGTHNVSESASIGLEDATGGPGHFLEATTGSSTTGVTTLHSATNWPTANYRFTPPPRYNTFHNLKVLKGTANSLTNPSGNQIIVNGHLTIN